MLSHRSCFQGSLTCIQPVFVLLLFACSNTCVENSQSCQHLNPLFFSTLVNCLKCTCTSVGLGILPVTTGLKCSPQRDWGNWGESCGFMSYDNTAKAGRSIHVRGIGYFRDRSGSGCLHCGVSELQLLQ